MSTALVKFAPGKVTTIGQGAQALGIKITKNQAITKLVDYAIRKTVPNLHPELHKHAVNYLTTAVNSLLKAGQAVDAKSLLAHAKRGLPGFLKTLHVGTPSVMRSDYITAANYRRGATSTSATTSGATFAPGGSTTYAPVSVSHNVSRKSKPRMSMRGDAIIVRHSEMLGAITSGSPTSNVTAFRCFGLRANPGLTSIFPWLSTMAVNYEKYRFRSLRFTIVPLVATSFSGRIGVGFDYDSSDVAPGSRQEFYALTNHAESMPWQATSISVKCDNTFRFTGTHVAADNKLIDQGQVILMSDSISGGTISAAIPLYDLIVDYEVELIEPQQSLFSTQLFQNTSLSVGNTLGVGSDSTTITGPTVATSVVVTSATVLTLNMPAGNYVICCNANWSAGAATVTTATATTGATVRTKSVSGSSFIAVIATLTAVSDAVVTITVGTVAWGTNQNAFNLLISRATSAVATTYTP